MAFRDVTGKILALTVNPLSTQFYDVDKDVPLFSEILDGNGHIQEVSAEGTVLFDDGHVRPPISADLVNASLLADPQYIKFKACQLAQDFAVRPPAFVIGTRDGDTVNYDPSAFPLDEVRAYALERFNRNGVPDAVG